MGCDERGFGNSVQRKVTLSPGAAGLGSSWTTSWVVSEIPLC